MSAPSKAPEGTMCRKCGNPANVMHDVRDGPFHVTRRVYDCAPCYGEQHAKAIFDAFRRNGSDTENAAEYLHALSTAIDDLQGLEVDLGGTGWVPLMPPYLTSAQIAVHRRIVSSSPFAIDDDE